MNTKQPAIMYFAGLLLLTCVILLSVCVYIQSEMLGSLGMLNTRIDDYISKSDTGNPMPVQVVNDVSVDKMPEISGSVSLTNDHSTPLPVEVTNEININAMPEITGQVEVTNSRPMPVEVLNLSPIQVEAR